MKAISQDESIYCGKCRQKTGHRFTLEHGSDFIILEVIRVSELKSRHRLSWRKNTLPISFPTSGISVPGTKRKYQVIATCHHRGTLQAGHWITKLMMSNKIWYECDDLKPENSVTNPPGLNDSSVVLLLLMAES